MTARRSVRFSAVNNDPVIQRTVSETTQRIYDDSTTITTTTRSHKSVGSQQNAPRTRPAFTRCNKTSRNTRLARLNSSSGEKVAALTTGQLVFNPIGHKYRLLKSRRLKQRPKQTACEIAHCGGPTACLAIGLRRFLRVTARCRRCSLKISALFRLQSDKSAEKITERHCLKWSGACSKPPEMMKGDVSIPSTHISED